MMNGDESPNDIKLRIGTHGTCHNLSFGYDRNVRVTHLDKASSWGTCIDISI